MSDNDISAALAAIEKAQRIVITAHDRPDGDALGATLGLARILRFMGKPVTLAGCQPLPPRYGFLLDSDSYVADANAALSGADLLVILDCGAVDRAVLADVARSRGLPILNIDHHESNGRFGDINWVWPQASSAAEMVEALAGRAGWKISPQAAAALWVGLATDTGRFSYENAHAEALACGSRLVAAGAKPGELNDFVYGSLPLTEVRLEALATNSLQLDLNGQLAWVTLSKADFASLNAGPELAGEVVNIPRRVAGVKAAFFIYEPPSGGVKVSLRTRPPLNAAEFLKQFGGGGHKRAAGCTLDKPLAEAREFILLECKKFWAKELG